MAVHQLSDGNPSGNSLGQSVTDKISFYNETPVVQPASADQAAITVGATATAANTLLIAMRTALVDLGLIKGAA